MAEFNLPIVLRGSVGFAPVDRNAIIISTFSWNGRSVMNRRGGLVLLILVAIPFGTLLADQPAEHRAEAQSSPKPRAEARDGVSPPQTTVLGASQQPISREGIEYLQKLRKGTPFGAAQFSLEALRSGMKTRRAPATKGVQLIQVKVKEIPCEWVVAPGANPNIRLLYLHGGGFVSGSGAFYLTLATHISAAAKCVVLLPDYRLAPEHPFPAGLEDCLTAFEWMRENGPDGPNSAKATLIGGDSAGGNLTLSTLLALRDRGRPLPNGAISLSATTDLMLESKSLQTVNDPILSARTMPIFRQLYLGASDARNPLASPVLGDFRRIPPLLIQVGEHEMLRDDSTRLATKAQADGIQVKLEVWQGMFHVFQSHEPLLPEARVAIEHIADFIRSRSLQE